MAYGLFYDTWAPITEAALNAGFSVLLGSFWGLNGVLRGTTLSILIIVMIWKPYFLFSKGFRISVWIYWKKVVANRAILLAIFAAMLLLNWWGNSNPTTYGWIGWLIYSLFVTGIFVFLLWGAMFAFTVGMRTLTVRISCMVRNKLKW